MFVGKCKNIKFSLVRRLKPTYTRGLRKVHEEFISQENCLALKSVFEPKPACVVILSPRSVLKLPRVQAQAPSEGQGRPSGVRVVRSLVGFGSDHTFWVGRMWHED